MLKHLRTLIVLSTIAFGLLAGASASLADEIGHPTQICADGGLGLDPNG